MTNIRCHRRSKLSWLLASVYFASSKWDVFGAIGIVTSHAQKPLCRPLVDIFQPQCSSEKFVDFTEIHWHPSHPESTDCSISLIAHVRLMAISGVASLLLVEDGISKMQE